MTEWNKMEPIYWTCLGKECPTSCCDANFGRKDAYSVLRLNDDAVPLSYEEKYNIINHCGNEFIMKSPDSIYMINIKGNESCPFWKEKLCSIHDSAKPAICRAYPLVMDTSLGVVIDNRCPGVEEGKRRNIRMDKATYETMVKALIEITSLRLSRLMAEVPEKNPPEFISRGINTYRLNKFTGYIGCNFRYG